ncbi:hypothetical protein JCM5353_005471 [Sporobolomyces roseus]
MAELPSHPHSGGYFAARKPLEAKQRSISVSERQCLTRLKDLQAIIGIYDRETVSGVMGPTNQEYAECLKFVEDKHGAVQHLVAVAKTALARAHAHQLLAAKMESIVGALELLEREDNVELTYDEYFGCFIELLVWAYSSSVPSTLSGSMLIHCIAARSLGWDQLVTGRTQFRALHGSGRAVEPLLHQVTEREWTSPHASTALRRGILKGMKSPGPYDGLVQLLAQLRLATRHDRASSQHSLAHTPISRRLVQRLI